MVLTVGDFLQLAPPKGQYAFLSDVWRGVFADRDVLLETHWRHVRDKNLLGILQRLRTGTHTSADMKMLATSRSRSAPSHVMWLFSTSWTRLTRPPYHAHTSFRLLNAGEWETGGHCLYPAFSFER